MPYETYALKWSCATGQSLENKNLKLTARKGRLEFHDSELESVRFNDVLKEIYQAVKRINRDNRQAAEVFILTEDERIITGLQRLMKDIQVGAPIDPEFENRNHISSEPTRAERLEVYLMELKPGKYAKRDICDALNIAKGNLSTVLKHPRISRLESAGINRCSTRDIQRLAN